MTHAATPDIPVSFGLTCSPLPELAPQRFGPPRRDGMMRCKAKSSRPMKCRMMPRASKMAHDAGTMTRKMNSRNFDISAPHVLCFYNRDVNETL